ncbi:Aste57867_11295 [Aphanomyces stellatus]|uniref:Protein HIRA n=1 Tax=Aphanomyces stellatus TaxID=120398 RepID=A0A485KT44_9STRA|nr:hypothetical protein As57867_011253 [Aphanomyces stellatus]VFT88157.1 Aste57867_11295 [Aphanomyces stellatus]
MSGDGAGGVDVAEKHPLDSWCSAYSRSRRARRRSIVHAATGCAIRDSAEDCAIYGIDAHPNKLKFATAGGDNCVKIWSLETVPEKEGPGFELLATLASHEQAVNCVRWSHNGRYLASGSDDHLVLLYELQEGPPAPVPFGSNLVPNKEKWVRCAMLKNHTMDVQDVAWSPDDRMLATCSIDNTILIWSMDQISSIMTHPIHHLTGHNGWVKGVAWDPVGKYLSSAGEDKSIIMWRVDTWEMEEKVEAPFEQGTTTSHFRRLSWAPDGSVVCGTHAYKNKQNVAALLKRKSWENNVNFVGHQGVVTTARFNPRLLAKSAHKEFACCALGGDDCTVTVWLADVSRPLAVVKKCFDSSFTADELGNPITPQQQSRLLQQRYGSLAGLTTGSTLIENSVQLELEGQQKQASLDKLAKRMTPSNAQTLDGSAATETAFTLVARPKAKKDSTTTPTTNSTTDVAAPAPPAAPTSSGVTMLTARPKTKKPDEAKVVATLVAKPKPPAIVDESHSPQVKRKRIEPKQKPSSSAPPPASNLLVYVPVPAASIVIDTCSLPETEAGSVPEIPTRPTFSIALKSTEKTLECKNVEEGAVVYASLSCIEAGTVVWMDRLPGHVVCMTGNQAFCAVGTNAGHLYILSPLGRRLFPCIALGYNFAGMECSAQASPYLLVISANGDLKTWNVEAKKCAVATTVCGMTTHKATLIRSLVTTTGQPIVTLAVAGAQSSLLHSFTYDLPMQCWMRVADDTFAYSDFQTHLSSDAVVSSEIPVGTLRRLQNASSHSRSAKTMLAGMNNSIIQHHVTRTHLEHQVAASLALQSSVEYLHWLKVYVRHLSHDGDILHLEEICKDFLGPPSAIDSTDEWSSHVLDSPKRDVLRTVVLPQMASNRVLQRLVQKYKLMLDEVLQEEQRELRRRHEQS